MWIPDLNNWHLLKTKEGYFFTMWNHKGTHNLTLHALTFDEIVEKIKTQQHGWNPFK